MGDNKKKITKKLISAGICILILVAVVGLMKGMETLFNHFDVEEAIEVQQDSKQDIVTVEEEPVTEEPAEEEVKDDGKLILCIDAGHGGKDNGSDYKKRLEKDDNLKMALALQSYMDSQGIETVMTRTDDEYITLDDRCVTANEANADYLVSLHRNKGDGYGVETWMYSGANEETEMLANGVQEGLVAAGVQRDRGAKKGTQKGTDSNYYINTHAEMSSCIIELGFLNSSKDNALYDENMDAYAKAIGDAVIATYNQYHPNSVIGSETVEGETETETEESTSIVLNNTQIENVASLDGTCQNWGQGVNFDAQNRPAGAVSYQEKYKDYSVAFIGDDGTQGNTIYLTFDEGYEYGCTPGILDTLKEKAVPAVFFLTEPYAKSEPELVQRMIDEGHELGNHSVNHPADGLPSETLEQQTAEIMDNHQYILDTFGYSMHLFRFPAGKFSDQSLAIVNNCNYKSAFWSFAYKDYDVNNQPNQSESLTKLVDRLHPGALYLLHAESETNTAILGSFIDQARAAGYEFKLLQ